MSTPHHALKNDFPVAEPLAALLPWLSHAKTIGQCGTRASLGVCDDRRHESSSSRLLHLRHRRSRSGSRAGGTSAQTALLTAISYAHPLHSMARSSARRRDEVGTLFRLHPCGRERNRRSGSIRYTVGRYTHQQITPPFCNAAQCPFDKTDSGECAIRAGPSLPRHGHNVFGVLFT